MKEDMVTLPAAVYCASQSLDHRYSSLLSDTSYTACMISGHSATVYRYTLHCHTSLIAEKSGTIYIW